MKLCYDIEDGLFLKCDYFSVLFGEFVYLLSFVLYIAIKSD